MNREKGVFNFRELLFFFVYRIFAFMGEHSKLLIIGKVWPEPNSSAAGTRMMQLISFFQRMEMEILFVSSANYSEFQYNLSLVDVSTEQIKLNDDSFDSVLKKYSPTMVLFDRFLTEEQFGWRVDECIPDAVKILNTEDLHFLRRAREEAVKKRRGVDETAIRTELFQRELASIFRCDLTLLVSDFEIKLLQEHYSVPKELLFYLPVFSKKNDSIPSYEERKDFIFIGNFLHEPNWDAVKVLKKEIWPLIRKKLSSSSLYIYGAYAGQKVRDLHNEREGFIVCGRVDDALLATKNAKISLVPLRFGAGIKGKLLEAMSAGTPFVTTSIGAEGMLASSERSGLVEDDFEKFTQASVELYLDKNKWLQAQNKGFCILEERFDECRYYVDFEQVVNKLKKEVKVNRMNNITGVLLKHHSVQSARYLSKWIMEKNKK